MRHFFAFVAFAAIALSVTARPATMGAKSRSQENILVREDRVWKKYISDLSVYLTEWFEGTTVIDGITYHNLHMLYTHGGDTKEFIVAYMREEDGKVYSRSCEVKGLGGILGSCFINVYDKDALAYDFNLTEGGVMRRFENPEDFVNSSLNQQWNTLRVLDKYSVSSQGNVFDLYEFADEYMPKQKFVVVQGVGTLESAICFPAMYNIMDSPDVDFWRTAMYDAEGNLLFDSRQLRRLSVTDAVADDVRLDGSTFLVPAASEATVVSVCELSGRRVAEVSGAACARIDLGSLSRGIYVVTVTDRRGSLTRKIAL